MEVLIIDKSLVPNKANIILNGQEQSGIANAASSEFEKDDPLEAQFYFKKL